MIDELKKLGQSNMKQNRFLITVNLNEEEYELEISKQFTFQKVISRYQQNGYIEPGTKIRVYSKLGEIIDLNKTIESICEKPVYIRLVDANSIKNEQFQQAQNSGAKLISVNQIVSQISKLKEEGWKPSEELKKKYPELIDTLKEISEAYAKEKIYKNRLADEMKKLDEFFKKLKINFDPSDDNRSKLEPMPMIEKLMLTVEQQIKNMEHLRSRGKEMESELSVLKKQISQMSFPEESKNIEISRTAHTRFPQRTVKIEGDQVLHDLSQKLIRSSSLLATYYFNGLDTSNIQKMAVQNIKNYSNAQIDRLECILSLKSSEVRFDTLKNIIECSELKNNNVLIFLGMQDSVIGVYSTQGIQDPKSGSIVKKSDISSSNEGNGFLMSSSYEKMFLSTNQSPIFKISQYSFSFGNEISLQYSAQKRMEVTYSSKKNPDFQDNEGILPKLFEKANNRLQIFEIYRVYCSTKVKEIKQ